MNKGQSNVNILYFFFSRRHLVSLWDFGAVVLCRVKYF